MIYKKYKEWIQLVFGIAIIIAVVWIIVPAINQQSGNPVMEYINKNDIDAGVLFYTESEEGLTAIENLKRTTINSKQ